jgi:hypothetical protein
MKIEEAIKALQEEKKNGTKNVIMAYWTAEDFEREDDAAWQEDLEIIDTDMEWSNAHEDLQSALDSLKD